MILRTGGTKGQGFRSARHGEPFFGLKRVSRFLSVLIPVYCRSEE